MRSPEEQKKLDDMTLEEKMERTTPDAMRERGIVVEEYKHWILCKNEIPHKERGDWQMVLWQNIEVEDWFCCAEDIAFHLSTTLSVLVESWYYVTRHPEKNQSCPFREHRHVYKWQ